MIEEGSQFVFEKSAAHHAGVLDSEYDYSTRGWLNRENDGTSKSLLEDMLTFGIPQLFKTKEGVESMLLGGLTGGIMEHIGGGERKKNKQTKENTAHAIGAFNANLPTAYMQEHFKSGVRSVAQEQQHSQEVAKGDIFNATNIREDGFLNWVLPRLYYGRKDMAIDELKQFKSDQMSFDVAKKQLGLADTVTSADLDKDIDAQIAQIHAIDKMATHVESIRPMRYLKDGTLDPTTKGMLYSLYKVDSLEKRMDTLAMELNDAGLTELHLLTDPKARKEAGKTLEEVRNSLTTELRANLKNTTKDPATYLQKLNDIERLQNARERFVNDYDQLRNDKFFTNSLLQNYKLDENITLDMYKSYEASAIESERVGAYEGNTEARKLASELSLALESKLSNNVPITINEINELKQVLTDNKSYLLEDDKNHIESLIKKSEDLLIKPAQLDKTKKDADWATLSDAQIDKINNYSYGDLINIQKTNGDPNLVDADVYYAALGRLAMLTSADDVLNGFNEIRELLEDAERATEPQSIDKNEVKRRIADKFTVLASAVIDAYELDKNGYDDLSSAEGSLKILENLRRVFNERDDVFDNKGFPEKAEYIQELDDQIEALKNIVIETKKNIENISKEDTEFAKNNHSIKSKIIGYDIDTDSVIFPTIYDKIKELIGEKKLLELLAEHKKASNPKFIYELYQHLRNALTTVGGSKESLNQIIAPLIAEYQSKTSSANNIHNIWNGVSPYANTDIMFTNPYNYYHDFIKAIFGVKSDIAGIYHTGRNITSVIKFLKENPTTATSPSSLSVAAAIEFFENSEKLKNLHTLKDIINLDSNFDYTKYWQAVELYVDKLKSNGMVPTIRQLQVIEDLVLNYYKTIDPTKEFAGWAYMDGRIGSGKTKVIATGFISIMQTLLKKSKIEDVALFIGDIDIAGTNLELSLGSTQNITINKNGSATAGQSINDMITRLIADDPLLKTHSLILCDEMARANKLEIAKLASAVAEFNLRNKTNIRVVGMGDVLQMSSNVSTNDNIIFQNPSIALTTPLSTSYRSLLFSMNVVQNIFDEAMSDNVLKTKDLKLVSSMNKVDKEWYGVTGVKKGLSFKDAESEMIATVAERSNTIIPSTKATRSILVVVNEGQKDIIESKLSAQKANLNNLNILTVKEAQGLTFDEAYVHLDPMAAEFNGDMSVYNSHMYTAIRARFYVHITTLEAENIEDDSLGLRYRDAYDKMKATQSSVSNDVTDIQTHLSNIFDAKYVKPTPSSSSTASTTLTPAEEAKKKAEAEAKAKAAKDAADKAAAELLLKEQALKKAQDDADAEAIKKAEAELEKAKAEQLEKDKLAAEAKKTADASSGPVPISKTDQTLEVEKESELPIIIDYEPDLDMMVEASGFESNGSVTAPGLFIDNPSSQAFKIQNIGNKLVHTEGDAVFILPVHPSATYADQTSIRWQVMKKVTVNGHTYYQELGVLSNATVVKLQSQKRLPIVSPDARYKVKSVSVNDGPVDLRNAKLFTFDHTDKKSASFSEDSPNVIKSVLKSATQLHYNYDYAFDPSISGNEFSDFDRLLDTWIKGMFRDIKVDDDEIKAIKANARVVVFGHDQSDYFLTTKKKYDSLKSPIPFKAGRAYIEIDMTKVGGRFNKSLPQFIELQPRSLQFNAGTSAENPLNTIINKWYAEPLTEFVKAVDDYHQLLMDILKANNISEDLLSDVAKSTAQRLHNTNAVIEEDVTDFSHGNSIYNKLMQYCVNMNYSYTKNNNNKNKNQKAEDLYNDIFKSLNFVQRKELFKAARLVYTKAHGETPTSVQWFDEKNNLIKASDKTATSKKREQYINLDTGEIILDPPNNMGQESQFIFPLLNLNKTGAALGTAQGAINQLTRGNRHLAVTNSDGSTTNIHLGQMVMHTDPKTTERSLRLEGHKLTASSTPKLYDVTKIGFDNFYTWALHILYPTVTSFKASMFQDRLRFNEEAKKMDNRLNFDNLLDTLMGQSEDEDADNYRYASKEWSLFLELTEKVSAVPNANGFANNIKIGMNAQSINTHILQSITSDTGTHQFGHKVFTDAVGIEHRKPIGLRINAPMSMSDAVDTRNAITFTSGRKNKDSPFAPAAFSKAERFKNFFTSSFVSVDDTKVSIAMPPSEDGTAAGNSPNTQSSNTGTSSSTVTPNVLANHDPSASDEIDEDEDENENDVPFLKTNDVKDISDLQDNTPIGDALIIENEMFDYLKTFIPNLTRNEFQVINSLQASTLFGKVNGKVWGAFKEGIVYAVQGNSNDAIFKQVLKHEAFHKIFRQYLNSAERERIIEEARIEYGLFDLSPKQIEEYLAVNFQKRPDIEMPTSLLQRFLNFIKSIYHLIFTHSHSIERFYKDIEKGKFKQQVTESEQLGDTALLNTLDLFENKEHFIPVIKGLYLASKYNAGKEEQEPIQAIYNAKDKSSHLTNLPLSSYGIALKVFNNLQRRLNGDANDMNLPGLRSRFVQSRSIAYYVKSGKGYKLLNNEELSEATLAKQPLYTKVQSNFVEITNTYKYPKPLNAKEIMEMNALMHLFSQQAPDGSDTDWTDTSVYPIFLSFVNEYYPQDLKHMKRFMQFGHTLKNININKEAAGESDAEDTSEDAAEDEIDNSYNDALMQIIKEEKDVDPFASLGTSARTWLNGLFITNEDGSKSPINENQAIAVLYDTFKAFPTNDLETFNSYLSTAFSESLQTEDVNIFNTGFLGAIIKKGPSSTKFKVLTMLLGRTPTNDDRKQLSDIIRKEVHNLITTLRDKGVTTEIFSNTNPISMWDLYDNDTKTVLLTKVDNYIAKYNKKPTKASDVKERARIVGNAKQKLVKEEYMFWKSGETLISGNQLNQVLYNKLKELAKRALRETMMVKTFTEGQDKVADTPVAFEPDVYFIDDYTFYYKGLIKTAFEKVDGKKVPLNDSDFYAKIMATLVHYKSPLAHYEVIREMFYRREANATFVDIVANYNSLVSSNMTQYKVVSKGKKKEFSLLITNADNEQFKTQLNLQYDALRSMMFEKTDDKGNVSIRYKSDSFKQFLKDYDVAFDTDDKINRNQYESAYKDFMNIMGLTINANIDYTTDELKALMPKLLKIANIAISVVPDEVEKDDTVDLAALMEKGAKSSFRALARFNRNGQKSAPTTTKNVNDKRRHNKDRITTAHKLINRIVDYSKEHSISKEMLIEEFPRLATPFYSFNPFNPLGIFGGDLTFKNQVQRLDGTLNNKFPIIYSKETKKDIINRMFNGYFSTQYLSPTKEGKARTIMTSPYPISNRSSTVMIETKPLTLLDNDKKSLGSVRDMIKTMIVQRLLMPTERNDLKVYSTWKDSAGVSFLSGLTDEHIEELQKLQGTFTDYTDLQTKNPNLDKYIDALIRDTERQARAMVDYIANMNKIAAGVTNGKYFSAKYAIPLLPNLEAIYNMLLENGSLGLEHFDIQAEDTSKLTDAEKEADALKLFTMVEGRLKLNKYEPKSISEVGRSEEFLMPLAKLFMANTYIQDFFLNQLTMGDPAYFKDSITIVKRLTSPWASYIPPMIGKFHAPSVMRTIAVDDITTYGYAGTNPDVDLIDGKLHYTEAEYKTLLDQYQKNNDIDKAKKLATLWKKREWTDGAGWMTERGRDHINKGYGRGMKMGNSVKPVMHNIENNPFNNKYAATVMNDNIVKQFPQMLALRLQMDFYGLTGTDLKRAIVLEKKRLFETLKGEEIFELNQLYDSQFNSLDTSPIIQAVPKSSIKYGNGYNTIAYDYVKQAYNDFGNTTVINSPMDSWGQQLDPVGPAEQRVSLPTQLLYFANVNGMAPEINERLIDALSKMQELATADLYEEGLTPGMNVTPDNALQDVTKIVLKSIQDNNHHTNTAQALAFNYKMSNLPTFSGSVVSSFNTYFKKNFLTIKFNGTAGVQVSQGLTTDALGKDLKWDPVNQVAEAYMPLVYQDQIMQANTELYSKWKKEKDPVAKLKLEREILDSLPLTFLGYRIPSTGINSAVKIKIKGFINDNENRVILPNEVTTKMGSDFDIDTLYIIRPNLFGNKPKDIAIAQYFNSNVAKSIGVNPDETLIEGFEDLLNEFNTILSLPYTNPKGETYNITITAKDKRRLKQKYYENVFLYSYVELLSRNSSLQETNKSISFERVNSILPNARLQTEQEIAVNAPLQYDDSLYVLLAGYKNEQFKKDYNAAKESGELYTNFKLQESLNKRMQKEIERSYNLTDFNDRTELQLLNQTGSSMTGVFASVQKTLAYIQTAIGFDFQFDEALHFDFNGHSYTGNPSEGPNGAALFKDLNGVSIFDELQWVVNAAVDNVKEQILAKLNMNLVTSSVITGGLLAGMPMENTMTLLNQPVTKYLSDIGAIKSDTIAYVTKEIMSSLGPVDNLKQRVSNLLNKYTIGINSQGVIDISKFIDNPLFSDVDSIRPYLVIEDKPELDIYTLRDFTYEGQVYKSVYHAYTTWKSGTFNKKAYDGFKDTDTKDVSISGERGDMLSALVTASILQAPNNLAESLNAYSLLEFKHNTNSNFNLAIIKGIEDARKQHELAYLQKNKVLNTDNELFIASQLKVLEILDKLQSIGSAVTDVQQVLSIMKDNPNQPVDMVDYKHRINRVFDIKTITSNDRISVRNVKDIEGLELPDTVSGLKIKKGFPLWGLDFTKIKLFNVSYNNWIKFPKHYLTNSMHILHPDIEKMSGVLQQVYKLKPSGFGDSFVKDSEKDIFIRNAIVKALYSKLHIAAPSDVKLENDNVINDIISMDTSSLVYTKRGAKYYGNRALAEEIIDLHYASKEKENLNNYFLSKMVIQPYDTYTGFQEITMMRINSSDSNEVSIMRTSFMQIDNDKRREFQNRNPDFEGYWFSPLQLKLIQYAIIEEGLTFGNSKISLFIPQEIRSQIANQMSDIFSDIIQNDGFNAMTDWVALKIALTNKAWVHPIEYGNIIGLEELEDIKLGAINETNLEDTKEAYVQINNKDKKVIKAKSYKYDPSLGVYYNLAVSVKGDASKLPPFISFETNFNKYVYIRVNTPLDKFAYYMLLPNTQDRQINIPNTVLNQGFSIASLMDGKTPFIHETSIVSDNQGLFDLYTNSEFIEGMHVYGYDNKVNGYLQQVNKYKVVAKNVNSKDDDKLKELIAKKDEIRKLPMEERTAKYELLNKEIEQVQIAYKLQLVEENKTIQQYQNGTNGNLKDLLLTTSQADPDSINIKNIISIDKKYGNGLFDPQYFSQAEIEAMIDVEQQIKCKN